MDRLYIIWMSGCEMCHRARPVLRAFRDKHPGVKVVPLDITKVDWKAKKWMPQVTPTLVHLDVQGAYHVYDGAPAPDGEGRIVNLKEMETWLTTRFPR